MIIDQNSFISLTEDSMNSVILNNTTPLGNHKRNIQTIRNSITSKAITKIETGIFKINTQAFEIFLFTKEFEELKQIKNISWESDWWILEKTIDPGPIPKPKKGILFLGSHKPGGKLIQWAQDEKIPLLHAKKSLWWIEKKEKEDLKIRRSLYP